MPDAAPAIEASSLLQSPAALLLNLVALLFMTMSVTMLIDLSHRLLGSDPDSLGLLAISGQAALTVAATSAFTDAGWAFLRRVFGPRIDSRTSWRLGLSALLFAVSVFLWDRVPASLASRYNTRAYNLNQCLNAFRPGSQELDGCEREAFGSSGHSKADVLHGYQRAAALDPALTEAHTNTGVLLEAFYRYDEAAEQYRQSILTAPLNAPDLASYANLARALLLRGDAMEALRVLDHAPALPAATPKTAQALLRNRAWAEYQLGFYHRALTDASHSDTAASTCLLAKTYAKLRNTQATQKAWTHFEVQYAALRGTDPVVEPDCPLSAEAFLAER